MPQPLQLKLQIIKPHIFLIQDMYDPNSAILKVETDIEVNYSEKKNNNVVVEETSAIKIQKLQIFRSRFQQEDEFWSILEPLNVRMDIRMDDGLELSSSIQGIHILISYQDIKFVNFLIDRLLKNPLMKNLLDSPQESVKLASKKVVQREKILIEVDSIIVSLINDCRDQNAPIADLFVLQTRLDISNWSSSMLLLASFNLSANHFNIMNLKWEPIFEIIIQSTPFFQFIGQRDSPDDTFNLKISTNTRLDINMTIPLLNNLISIGTTWIDDLKNTKLTPPMEFIPFSIQNETGFPLEYWLTDDVLFKSE